MKNIFTAALLVLIAVPSLVAAEDPLKIPDTDEGVPGAGPLRRTEWFRGVWSNRRGSWLGKTEAQRGSVVFFGDSITEGWGDDFKVSFGGLRAANRGISGDTSRGLLLRLKEDVIDLAPKAVVIMIGANDLAEKAGGEIVFGNVKMIIEALKGHRTTMPIVLCETFPCSPDDYRPVAQIRKINALYAETWADDPQVILLKTYALFAGDDGASLPKYMPDRVHPNADGYAVWAAALRPVFGKLGFGDTTPEPLAWIHFTRYDREVALDNGRHVYSVDRKEALEFTIDVPPNPGHKLAFQWITQPGPVRSMTVEVNGARVDVSNPSVGDGKEGFFWKVLPITEFGIKEKSKDGNYRLRILDPPNAQDDAAIAGIRLITDEAQLELTTLPGPNQKVTFVAPGPMSEAERAALNVDRPAPQ